MAEIKCRKCKLTYDKKNTKCPYCKTARPRPGIIAGVIVVLGIIVLILSTRGEVLNILPTKTKYIDGMRIQVESASASDSFINEILELDEIEVRMVVTNFTFSEKNLNFKIKAYTDEYEADTSWFFSETNVRVNKLLPWKKCVQIITVSPQVDEWNKLVLYYCTDSGNYRKFCVIKRKNIQ